MGGGGGGQFAARFKYRRKTYFRTFSCVSLISKRTVTDSDLNNLYLFCTKLHGESNGLVENIYIFEITLVTESQSQNFRKKIGPRSTCGAVAPK